MVARFRAIAVVGVGLAILLTITAASAAATGKLLSKPAKYADDNLHD